MNRDQVVQGELVRTTTPDQLELNGFMALPDSKTERAILMLHEMYGDFYSEPFIPLFSRYSIENDFGFLTVNTRAHDYLIRCRKWESVRVQKWISEGGAHEKFDQSLKDIEGWLNFLRSEGFNRVVLAGYGVGGLKAANYAIEKKNLPTVKGIALISPPDIINLQKDRLGEKFNKALNIAQDKIEDENENELMPEWAFNYPISASTYQDFFSINSTLYKYCYTGKDSKLEKFNQIDVPLMVTFAESDWSTAELESEEALDIIKNKTKEIEFKGNVLSYTDHTYQKVRDELASEVVDWSFKVFD